MLGNFSDDLGRCIGFEAIRNEMVTGQEQAPLGIPSRALHRQRIAKAIGFDEGMAGGSSVRSDERVSHRTSDREHVRVGGEGFEHREFVGDLRATKDDQQRADRVADHSEVA